MPASRDPAELIYEWWERILNAQSEAFGGDREFTELSNKMDEIRSAYFADRQVSARESEALYEKMAAVAQLYAGWAAKKGIKLDAAAPITKESFQVFREAAEIHFQTLAGAEDEFYRGGLLRELLDATDPSGVIGRIVMDVLTSASTAIAIDKLRLIRAQLSLWGDGPRQNAMLERIRSQLASQLAQPVWTSRGRRPLVDLEQFDAVRSFESVVAVCSVPLPKDLQGTNRQLPNRPIPGRDSASRAAVRELFAHLRSAGRFFLDGVPRSANAVRIAVKIELNLGIEGPPSVTDPAATYGVIAELLELAEARGIDVRLSVGDSNGIENAPFGRTSFDVMRDTGNYHAALKAALEFAARPSMPEARRGAAQASLKKLAHLEQGPTPAYFGGADDSVTSQQDLAAAEAAASPWLECVDYDQAGFRAVDHDLGPLGRAAHGSDRFHLAEPWVAADYRVHVSRGVSNHLYAGWTGAVKGLIGLHALGGRPADLGMKRRGENPLEVLLAVMRTGSITGLFARRGSVADFPALASACEDPQCRTAIDRSAQVWGGLSQFAAGREIWAKAASALDAELRRSQAAGVADIEIMAKMRRTMADVMAEADRASPGFRKSLMQGVAEGTGAFLLTMWRMREHIPPEMRDESLGLRIGLLSRLPYQADLVVQSLPKVGLGGGPDAYFEVRDAGLMVAGTDEISVDVTAIRYAGVTGNPWQFNQPIHGAVQFGRGPMSWDEIRTVGSPDAQTQRQPA